MYNRIARTRAIRPVLSAALLLMAGACSVFGGAAAPEPAYITVRADEAFEIRDYGQLVVVKTSMGVGDNDAFGRLFDYISGENQGAREIAMTAPVLATSQSTEIAMTAPVLQLDGDETPQMAFILTDEFTPETAPLPTNPDVTLGTMPARRVAVITYNGSWRDGSATAETELRTWMAAEGLEPTGPASVAGYNPPWTLPAFRRNEVQIPIARE
ncbi:MAG: heme-binding protein [Pseudomonadota bacterium]